MDIFNVNVNDIKRTLIWGPVCVGKTGQLALGMKRVQRQGLRALTFIPEELAERGVSTMIQTSRDGISFMAHVYKSVQQAIQLVLDNGSQVVFIEESQFIDSLEEFLDVLDSMKINTFMTALNCDFTGQPWPVIHKVLHTCNVVQVPGVCYICQSTNALYSPCVDGTAIPANRIAIDTEKSDSTDKYRAACRTCFRKSQIPESVRLRVGDKIEKMTVGIGAAPAEKKCDLLPRVQDPSTAAADVYDDGPPPMIDSESSSDEETSPELVEALNAAKLAAAAGLPIPASLVKAYREFLDSPVGETVTPDDVMVIDAVDEGSSASDCSESEDSEPDEREEYLPDAKLTVSGPRLFRAAWKSTFAADHYEKVQNREKRKKRRAAKKAKTGDDEPPPLLPCTVIPGVAHICGTGNASDDMASLKAVLDEEDEQHTASDLIAIMNKSGFTTKAKVLEAIEKGMPLPFNLVSTIFPADSEDSAMDPPDEATLSRLKDWEEVEKKMSSLSETREKPIGGRNVRQFTTAEPSLAMLDRFIQYSTPGQAMQDRRDEMDKGSLTLPHLTAHQEELNMIGRELFVLNAVGEKLKTLPSGTVDMVKWSADHRKAWLSILASDAEIPKFKAGELEELVRLNQPRYMLPNLSAAERFEALSKRQLRADTPALMQALAESIQDAVIELGLSSPDDVKLARSAMHAALELELALMGDTDDEMPGLTADDANEEPPALVES